MTVGECFSESGGSPPEQAELESAIQAALVAWKDACAFHRKAWQTTREHAVEVGTLLTQLKRTVEHGQWLPALRRLGLHERRAQRFMRLAAKSDTVSHLTTAREAEKALAQPKAIKHNDTEPKQAPPTLIQKWRAAWTSLNVTQAEVEEVERAVETWHESLRIIRAAQKRVLDVYPKRAPEIGPAAAMDGNLDGIGKAFRHLFETDGVGDGHLTAPSPGG